MTGNLRSCRPHCAACGGHFATDGAFDRHRQGVFQPDDGEQPRHCGDPDELETLELWTEKARCTLARGCYRDGKLVDPHEPVLIWHVAGWRERAEATAAYFERSR